MIKPLFNNCLVEVIDEYAGIVRNTETESVQKGVLRDHGLMPDHLTASAGYKIGIDETIIYGKMLDQMVGKTVYWQEYADAGSKFMIDGKKYVLIPFYRLTGVEE